MTKFLTAIFAGALLLTVVPALARADSAPQKSYVVLNKDLARLRADFNANVGKVRMLYLVGPTCGICLRGMSDLQETLYSKQVDDPRMATFVVHVPTLGAREENVEPASHLIVNRFTTHYWEESGIIGRQMQHTIGANIYVWDFWAIYGPKAVWASNGPPVPDFWQHQLDGLPSEKKLDATVFAAKVNEILAQVKPAKAVESSPDVNRKKG